MVKPTTKSITFTAVTIMIITILTLTLPDIALNGFSQTRNDSESKLKTEILDFQSPNTNSTVKTKTLGEEEIAMKVQLIPHENKYLKDWYQISNFAFVASNTSNKVCPSDICGYELENGEMAEEFVPGERSLTGKFIIDTGISKNLMNLTSYWKAVKELDKDGETIQIIDGTLKVSKNAFVPEQEYQINGTLSSDNDGYVLEVKSKK
jgi:hypothetical protein